MISKDKLKLMGFEKIKSSSCTAEAWYLLQTSTYVMFGEGDGEWLNGDTANDQDLAARILEDDTKKKTREW